MAPRLVYKFICKEIIDFVQNDQKEGFRNKKSENFLYFLAFSFSEKIQSRHKSYADLKKKENCGPNFPEVWMAGTNRHLCNFL